MAQVFRPTSKLINRHIIGNQLFSIGCIYSKTLNHIMQTIEPPTYDAEWKRWLAGGFAFLTADFAGHPCDEERARKMYYCCLVDNISLDEIKTEARKYLESKGVYRGFIEESVQDVVRFYERMQSQSAKQKKRAWLITWEYDAIEKPIEDRIISIRDSRTPSAKIREFVEQHYVATCYPLAGKMIFSTTKRAIQNDNPYSAEYINPRQSCNIRCGKDPWIYARIVENLTITSQHGKEQIHWEDVAVKMPVSRYFIKHEQPVPCDTQ